MLEIGKQPEIDLVQGLSFQIEVAHFQSPRQRFASIDERQHVKGDLAIRPIHHQLEERVEAHILVAFLGYALLASLRLKLQYAAPGLTPRAVLEKLSAIRMVDVCIPTTDGRLLVMPRYIEPEADQQLVLDKLHLSLPPQPPPRIRAGEVILPADGQPCSADL